MRIRWAWKCLLMLAALLAAGALATRAGSPPPVRNAQRRLASPPGVTQPEPPSADPCPPDEPDYPFYGDLDLPVSPTEPGEGDSWRRDNYFDDVYQDYEPPAPRAPAPIRPARPLPFYPAEPSPAAPPGYAVTAPPDFGGSAAGYLELPVGQTATLITRGAFEAAPQDPAIARVVALEPDRLLVRGLFPGRTLLDVWSDNGKETYLLRVR